MSTRSSSISSQLILLCFDSEEILIKMRTLSAHQWPYIFDQTFDIHNFEKRISVLLEKQLQPLLPLAVVFIFKTQWPPVKYIILKLHLKAILDSIGCLTNNFSFFLFGSRSPQKPRSPPPQSCWLSWEPCILQASKYPPPTKKISTCPHHKLFTQLIKSYLTNSGRFTVAGLN